MDGIEFDFIGWNHEGEHDKVWTAFHIDGSYYAGWGRRGKTLRFKKHRSGYELDKMITKKQKTYNEVDQFQLFTIFPYFKEDVSKYLTFDLMANKIM